MRIPKPDRRWLGPAVFALLLILPTGSLQGPPKALVACIAWMALWWVTEAAPLAVTALLPLVLFPLLGLRGVEHVAPRYADSMIFLFLGGFVLALAVQGSGLHRRLALGILTALGASPRRLVWGFLVATAALSMWLSNTATTLMLLPIAAGVVQRAASGPAAPRVFLAVAYGASIGGLGTLVGTPPNLVLAGMAPKLVPGLPALSFGGWMLFGVPLVCLLLPLAGLLLARGLGRVPVAAADEVLRAERVGLGPTSSAEWRAALLFGLTALAWVTRTGADFGSFSLPGWSALLPEGAVVSDAVPAIAAAVVAALLPRERGAERPMLTWDEIAHGVPWGVLLLFGGGFAIADAVQATALDGWLAERLTALAALPLPLLVLALAAIANASTELTSNTATATLLMPVLAALAEAIEISPYLLMVPAIVSCSCAFMLPVATPPNAIVIGSGHLGPAILFREGLRLNIASALLVSALTLTLGRWVLPL